MAEERRGKKDLTTNNDNLSMVNNQVDGVKWIFLVSDKDREKSSSEIRNIMNLKVPLEEFLQHSVF